MKRSIVIFVSVLIGFLASATVTANGKGPIKSSCPCNLFAPIFWAGWDGPGCYINEFSGGYSIQLFTPDSNSAPQIFLIADTDIADNNDCTTISDIGIVDNELQVSDEDFADCEKETDKLAILLGRTEGCSLP